MDGRTIRVHHVEIDRLCRDLASCIGQIDEELNGLEASAAVLSGQWSGAAQQAYARAHREWDASLRELTAIAHELTRIAHEGNQRFRQHDQRDAAVWSV